MHFKGWSFLVSLELLSKSHECLVCGGWHRFWFDYWVDYFSLRMVFLSRHHAIVLLLCFVCSVMRKTEKCCCCRSVNFRTRVSLLSLWSFTASCMPAWCLVCGNRGFQYWLTTFPFQMVFFKNGHTQSHFPKGLLFILCISPFHASWFFPIGTPQKQTSCDVS